MTTHVNEVLRHNGESLSMCATPLSLLLEQQSIPWTFKATLVTAPHRRYVGTWQIEGARLYLIGLQETGDTFGQWNTFPMEAVFPGFPDGVFAHWFTGDLRCVRGKFLQRVRKVYGDIYEEDVIFRFQRGVLEKEWVVCNTTTPPAADAAQRVGVTT